jgi:hypothetical protein
MIEFLKYNPETGDLRWKTRPESSFKTTSAWKTWNTKLSGEPAGTVTPSRRVQITFGGKTHQAMHVIVEIMTGQKLSPQTRIYPKNGDYTDLRWENITYQ